MRAYDFAVAPASFVSEMVIVSEAICGAAAAASPHATETAVPYL